ncbi:alpha/beta hydrolase [Mitsuaria sp. GD03876]|uniref:alpha/beta fold hydrolase n=1 Tax=Mitsuaria sp. GD03876 TaxID=2975399 RepID=UPI002448CC40|nr:alpha/beta hydrolase [Mitsuaria sp. GD03876]MDH0865041.1 alpha/beta hydrolase [Mitsuaria sp. GD03876]
MTPMTREPVPSPAALQIADHALHHDGASIHARSWTPTAAASTRTGAGAGAAPIVLMHDSLGSVSLWRGFPEALAIATGRRVVAYDRAGFGQSGALGPLPEADFIAAEARGAFLSVVDQLGLDRFVVLGHSVGGGMSVEIAAQLPERCEALITISAQAFVEDRTIAGVRASRDDFQAPGQMERLAKYHGDKASWVLHAWTERWLAPEFAAWSLRSTLPRVTCPLLTIHGELDEYGSTAHQDLIAGLVSGPARKLTMAGIGHGPHREAPEAVIAAVAEFLA